MNRKTLTALAVLGLLVIVAVVVLRQPEKGERTADRPRPLPQLKAGDFDTLAVTKDGKTTVIKKEGDKYEVTQPVKYPADENVAKQAFEAIEKLEFGNLVTEQKAKHAEFEVDDAKGVKVAIKKGDQSVGELIVGKTTGANTLVRVAGKDQVWQALGSIRYNFDRDTANWRDKTIVKFTQADAEKIEIKSPAGDISLKKGSGDQWVVDQSTLKIDKLDTAVAPAILSTLTSFVANEFADDAKPEQTGPRQAVDDHHRVAEGRQERHGPGRQQEGRRRLVCKVGREPPGLHRQALQRRADQQATAGFPRQDPV